MGEVKMTITVELEIDVVVECSQDEDGWAYNVTAVPMTLEELGFEQAQGGKLAKVLDWDERRGAIERVKEE